MKCPICKQGETKPGTASVTLVRDATTIVFRDVPASICQNCGEAYHSAEVTAALMQRAEQAVVAGVEVDVRRFAAAACCNDLAIQRCGSGG